MKQITTKEYSEKDFFIEEHKSYPKGDINEKIILSLKDGKKVLSMGCGAGREVKLLVSKGMDVTAVDFSKGMIESSKRIEPRAKYYQIDIIKFLKQDKGKYDYILGLYNFFNGIDKEDRRFFLESLHNKLADGGVIILKVRLMEYGFKNIIRSILSFIAIIFTDRYYEFGDLLFRSDKGEYAKSHFFTKGQLTNLLREYDNKIEGEVIYIGQ